MKIQNSNGKRPLPKFLRQALVGASIAAALASTACGRDTKVYSDPQVAAAAPAASTPSATTSTPSTTVTVIDGRSTLPKNYYDQSVNAARTQLAFDGLSANSVAIELQTLPQTNGPGGFNGSGTGNRALLGVGGYDSTALSTLTAISFDGLVVTGTQLLSMTLVVDINCDGSAPRVFSALSTTLNSQSTSSDGHYRTFNAGLDQAVWQVSGAAITSGATTLVPSTSATTTSSLSAFITAYPKACLVNRASGDAALPNALPTAAILFSFGATTTTDSNTAFIKKITLGTTTTSATDWSTL